jgi:hypothetical protein
MDLSWADFFVTISVVSQNTGTELSSITYNAVFLRVSVEYFFSTKMFTVLTKYASWKEYCQTFSRKDFF